jgi:hypothetical protein
MLPGKLHLQNIVPVALPHRFEEKALVKDGNTSKETGEIGNREVNLSFDLLSAGYQAGYPPIAPDIFRKRFFKEL